MLSFFLSVVELVLLFISGVDLVFEVDLIFEGFFGCSAKGSDRWAVCWKEKQRGEGMLGGN